MPKILKKTKRTIKKTPKKISPFKSQKILEKEIKDFANKFRTTVANQAKRISDYFEMSCFNYIVHFYELKGFTVEVMNLQTEKYRYKCSTSGIQSNFSYFKVSVNINSNIHAFEIQHNLAVQSSHDNTLFTTPDISIIKVGKVKYTSDYYNTKRIFSFVENSDFITFCEVKQFNPFPELIFNFIGVLNEIKKEYMNDDGIALIPEHIAPSLMISGKSNKQTDRIKKSLEGRYCVNIIYDLFYSGSITFSRSKIKELRITGKKPSS